MLTFVTGRPDKIERIRLEFKDALKNRHRFIYGKAGRLYERLSDKHEPTPLGYIDGRPSEITGDVVFVLCYAGEDREAFVRTWFSEGAPEAGCTWRLVKLRETTLGFTNIDAKKSEMSNLANESSATPTQASKV